MEMAVTWCHGTESSLRLRGAVEGGLMFLTVATYRINRNGAAMRSSNLRHLGSPNMYRRYVPGSNRSVYAEPPPFPEAKWCGTCGFVFAGGWSVRD